MNNFQRGLCSALLVTVGAIAGSAVAQSVPGRIPSRITGAIDNRRLVVLPGNTAPLAREEFDRGAVEPQMPMTHMLLLLQRSAEQENELEALIAQQSDPNSPKYQQWLTPTEFGEQFGPSDSDVAQVTGWLQSQGLSVEKISNGRVTVEFSGSAAQVQTAFHTSIHHYVVDGVTHFANTTDPEIPQALASVVSGVTSLHNFFPKSLAVEGKLVRRNSKTGAITAVEEAGSTVNPQFTRTNSSGNTREDVTPNDFATIYNVLPVWNAGLTGTGQTIAIAGESDINLADVATFQQSFGMANNPPTVLHNGTAPGYTSLREEQELDVEWAGAVAPGATILLVVTANTGSTNGFQLSAQEVIDNRLATILSESFGLCESSVGTTGNATYNALWQQGAAEGISIFGASGDQGSAGCENSSTHSLNPATTGLNVNGVASSPYITAVGGTDFLWQTSAPGTYWSSSNSSTDASALGYIPEIPWNATCTSPYVVALYGAANAEANCNTLAGNSATSNLVFITGGSGGVSNCTTSSRGVCSGGYAKPSWQTGTGVPADGKRDVPDVSLFAGSGLPDGNASSSYLICYSASEPCTYSDSTDVTYQEVGGTSVSAPAMAGIMALVQQKLGRAQGLANPVLYQLAAAESSLSACNSNTVGSGNSCVFYDTTTGTNAMPCKSGSPNCTVNTVGDTIGVLSGYSATTGYDQATGLGSVNVANLIAAWASVPAAPITFSIANKTYGAAPFTVSASSSSSGAFSYSIVSGPATISGSTVTITGAGTVVVNAFQAAASGYSAGSANATFVVAQAAPTITFSVANQTYGAAPFTVSASSNSTGAFSYSIVSGPATISGATVTLTGVGTVMVQAQQAPSGNYAAGSANASFTVAQAAPTITFTIPNQSYGAAPFTVSASSNSTGAFTYSIVSGPATISGATVTLTGAGTVMVKAQQAASTNYTAGSVTASFTVSQTAPTIAFTVPNQTYGAAPFTVSASSNSTGAFTYSIVSGPATISGATVTLTGVGTVMVQAQQAASANYSAGSTTASFSVAQAAPTITFSVPNQTYGAAPFTVSASSNSTGAFTYSIVSGPATISGSTVTLTGSGTVVVQAAQAAAGNYSSGSANASFTAGQASPSITFSVPNQTYGAAPFTVSASSNSTGAISYSIVSGPATISGSTITLTGTGTVTVQAQEAVSANYAAGSKSTSFTVTATTPTITFAIPNQSYGAAPFAVSASSNSTGAFTYSIVSGPATISGATVTVTGTGTVTVQSQQAATANYAAGSATASFTVAQATPTITFSIPNQSYGAAPFAVSASSNSTGAFTYTIVSGPATISGATVTLTGAGTVMVQAQQAATANDSAGSATASFTVAAANGPTLQFSIADQTYGSAPFAVSATSNSTGALTYAIVSGPATISGSTITLTGAGTVVAQASQAASTNYAAGSVTASFNVSQQASSVNWNPVVTTLFAGNPLGKGILNASSSVPGTIAYMATPGSAAATPVTASSTLLAPGVYTLSATMTPSNASYSPATTSITLTVTAAYLWVVNPAGSFTQFNGDLTLSTTATAGGGVGAAVDSADNLWTIHAGGDSLAEFNTSGTALQSGLTGGGLKAATALAIDGNGAIWLTNGNSSVSVFASNGSAISPSTGYMNSGISAPAGVAIDTSGNVWIANAGNNSVTEILGAAAPTSPTTTAVQNKTLGVRP